MSRKFFIIGCILSLVIVGIVIGVIVFATRRGGGGGGKGTPGYFKPVGTSADGKFTRTSDGLMPDDHRLGADYNMEPLNAENWGVKNYASRAEADKALVELKDAVGYVREKASGKTYFFKGKQLKGAKDPNYEMTFKNDAGQVTVEALVDPPKVPTFQAYPDLLLAGIVVHVSDSMTVEQAKTYCLQKHASHFEVRKSNKTGKTKTIVKNQAMLLMSEVLLARTKANAPTTPKKRLAEGLISDAEESEWTEGVTYFRDDFVAPSETVYYADLLEFLKKTKKNSHCDGWCTAQKVLGWIGFATIFTMFIPIGALAGASLNGVVKGALRAIDVVLDVVDGATIGADLVTIGVDQINLAAERMAESRFEHVFPFLNHPDDLWINFQWGYHPNGADPGEFANFFTGGVFKKAGGFLDRMCADCCTNPGRNPSVQSEAKKQAFESYFKIPASEWNYSKTWDNYMRYVISEKTYQALKQESDQVKKTLGEPVDANIPDCRYYLPVHSKENMYPCDVPWRGWKPMTEYRVCQRAKPEDEGGTLSDCTSGAC